MRVVVIIVHHFFLRLQGNDVLNEPLDEHLVSEAPCVSWMNPFNKVIPQQKSKITQLNVIQLANHKEKIMTNYWNILQRMSSE